MSSRPLDYKDLTYLQLRSFCETARMGGMSAAAQSLGVAQPTIWKQIHSLETHLGVKLIESHARGCRVTSAGQYLLLMVQPLVAEFEALPKRFRTAIGDQTRTLTVSATPRPFDEELLPCVAAFERQHPKIRLVVRQLATRNSVIESVKSGDADVGLASIKPEDAPPELCGEPIYELEPVLLVPRGHPLARRTIRLEDFAKYPVLNSRTIYADWGIAGALERVGAFNHPDRRIELEMARSIRLYVQNGMGIGIVVRPAAIQTGGEAVERPLRALFRIQMRMYAYHRQRLSPDPEVLDFIAVVRSLLQTRGLKR
jgi:DNA-binding transcriptional LysR family regulator